ncbi:winged helix-turn-helix domain-containing protein [Blastomonas marina]|uniref:OmpR/PhoB-type domain-containing protein n=1 Tax=Blastomonas marina TaxID=1867408 RepID=A0ABQ1FAE5_9SPHN|nr:winged helix-turn-helix domain-containing protein [Blastomonas marina]WPZ04803.1 winged helix-turn-helix domain-containing protein [Blastomonas marina]GGA04289.1 hypothetical protein GCM10010923_11880 [Blastomonas marina]
MKSTAGPLQFDRFTLIPAQRRLLDDGEPVALSGRYLDALVLLASEPQAVITKERLHEEVWRGVPVTDEAITQCIRALRKALGDDATSPSFIETVPKHGYRFIAAPGTAADTPPPATPAQGNSATARAGAMVLGGAAAGACVGLVYGFAAAQSAGSSLSLLLVMICVAALAAGVSALGIALGIVLIGGREHEPWRTMFGGALGGLLTGALANLLGRDAFGLLFGSSPVAMTGAVEGLVLGLACGVSVALLDLRGHRMALGMAAVLGAATGALLILLDGTLFGGSLASLAQSFPGSALALPWGGQSGGGALAVGFGAMEGCLFVAGIVAAVGWVGRR